MHPAFEMFGFSSRGWATFEWEIRNEKLEMVVRRIIFIKRRGVLIALRAVVISSVAEKSLLQNAHCLM